MTNQIPAGEPSDTNVLIENQDTDQVVESVDNDSTPQAWTKVPEAEKKLPPTAVPPNPHGEPVPIKESLSSSVLTDEWIVPRQ